MTISTLTDADLAAYERRGYHVARQLFDADEVRRIRERFDAIAEAGVEIEGHWKPAPDIDDPLARYPRIVHPHVFDPLSKEWLLDRRVYAVLRQLLDDEPVACQSMFYFKPPGARGQAFHQDNYYLKIKPHTCIAAWLAVDHSTPENGGLQVCPGTHVMEIECPEEDADLTQSFTRHYVAPPPGHQPAKLVLEPGDVLFFNGRVVHGSQPNTTKDQWRRSFISHYMPASATHVTNYNANHMFDFNGQPVYRKINGDGGPCGIEADLPSAEAIH